MEDVYLLTRKQAIKRYGMCMRSFEMLYKADETFPLIRNGKTILIPQKQADEWFARHIGGDCREAVNA